MRIIEHAVANPVATSASFSGSQWRFRPTGANKWAAIISAAAHPRLPLRQDMSAMCSANFPHRVVDWSPHLHTVPLVGFSSQVLHKPSCSAMLAGVQLAFFTTRD